LIDSNERLQARLSALRNEFDQSFARERQAPEVLGTDYLLIRVAGEPCALRLAEVAALEADRAITPVPSDAPALLGVGGLRGALVAVFDLAQLLGHAPPSAPRPASAPGQSGPATPRWLVLVKGSLVAMAFGEFEGQRRLGLDALARAQAGQHQEVLRVAGVSRPIVQLAALAERCEPRLPPAAGVESG
jgi:chemotaxis signal transduction protein